MSQASQSIWSRRFYLRPHPNRTARKLVEESGLPTPVRSWILDVTQRSRLWRSERAEVAREIIAHALDAIEHGKDPDELLASMGDPKTLAKLVRRSMKRKRPWIWKRFRDTRRAIGVIVVLLVIFYGTLAARFYLSSPSVTTNYLAQMNERREQFDESEHAWPIYEEVVRSWRKAYQEERDIQDLRAASERTAADVHSDYEREERFWAGIDNPDEMSPDHPDYERTVSLYKSFRPNFDRVIEASTLPALGVLYTARFESIEHPDGTLEERAIPPSHDPNENEPLFNVLLPHLGSMRQFTNLLSFDAIIAAREGDADRAQRDLLAILHITRQLQQEPGFIISDMVGIAMISMCRETLLGLIQDHPALFSKDQLIELAHTLSDVSSRVTMSFENEQIMFYDLLQRVYTDNGNGNGHLTPEGMKLISEISSIYENIENFNPNEGFRAFLDPAATALLPDRKSAKARYDGYMNTFKSVLHEGPQSSWKVRQAEQQIVIDSDEAIVLDPVDIMTPALGSATHVVFRSNTESEASVLALALEIHRIDHGRYPDSLGSLSPKLVPSIPEDPMNPGRPMLYKRTDTGYLIYSTGSDGDDDDGNGVDKRSRTGRDAMNFEIRYGQQPVQVTRTKRIFVAELKSYETYAQQTPPDLDWILVEMDRSQNPE